MKQLLFLFRFLVSGSLLSAPEPALARVKQMRGYGGSAGGSEIVLVAANNIYTTGGFSGTVDLEPRPGTLILTAGQEDMFFSKLDVQGNFLWAKAMGDSGSGYGSAIVSTNSFKTLFL